MTKPKAAIEINRTEWEINYFVVRYFCKKCDVCVTLHIDRDELALLEKYLPPDVPLRFEIQIHGFNGKVWGAWSPEFLTRERIKKLEDEGDILSHPFDEPKGWTKERANRDDTCACYPSVILHSYEKEQIKRVSREKQ